jgi:tRNA uridine 5-carbamoylmethylation protein Kti12
MEKIFALNIPTLHSFFAVDESDISTDVLEFISEHITSMEQLEVLLALYNQPEKEWTAEAVYLEIQSSQSSVSLQLRELCNKGLLIQTSNQLFRYSPRTPTLAQTVRALAAVYKERRIKVIELIYRKQIDKVQSFADAFRIRKDKPNA